MCDLSSLLGITIAVKDVGKRGMALRSKSAWQELMAKRKQLGPEKLGMRGSALG